jgi:2-dehydro-3-deoxygluconokinase
LTLGKDGALGCEPGGSPVHQPTFPAEEVGRLGGGDAFAAGFLYQYLTAPAAPDRLAQALLWGVATAAIKYTIPGDIPWISRAEVESLIQQGAARSKLVR